MKLFLTITKKKLAIIFCIVVMIFMGSIWVSSLKVSLPDGSTHAKRMVYISGLGLDVDEESCTSKETQIPEKFSDVYLNYNKLQKKGGFDLSEFKGDGVTVYSYPVKNSDKILTLIVCDGQIIGGDVAETKIGGKMTEIRKY
ncbi:MAG: DUF4830 domain-containing protein [Clostridia bacterium]|nr:DUF4830 domain-containing protein [Clostridia bacterium]